MRRMKISLPLVVIVLALSLVAGEPARAFKPTEGYGHWGITNTALSRIAVTSSDGDELRFTAVIEEEIASLGVSGRVILGRRVEVQLEEGRVSAFPVAVHDLREADSLVLQRAGLGRGQPVGCGLLIPHKTIHAAD